jgi:hypothetical protein
MPQWRSVVRQQIPLPAPDARDAVLPGMIAEKLRQLIDDAREVPPELDFADNHD